MDNLWAELPSPLKTGFREAFWEYCTQLYEQEGVLLTSYIPSEMGGSMKSEDYLIHMKPEELPECYVTMSYGECSDPVFTERFFKTGIYKEPEIFGFFSEELVIDRKRLADRPIPENFEQLCRPEYRGEICLIGNCRIPDPAAALQIYRSAGVTAMQQFLENVGGFAAPVDTIRHIGKKTNRFGSIFLMPSMFAEVCEEKESALRIVPKGGSIAEPMIYMEQKNSKHGTWIREFLFSEDMKSRLKEKRFVCLEDAEQRIQKHSRNAICPELEFVYAEMRRILRKTGIEG